MRNTLLNAGRGAAVAIAVLLAGPVGAQRAPGTAPNQRVAPTDAFMLRAVPTNPGGSRPSLTDAQPVLRRVLGLRPQDELRPLRTETDELGGAHVRYQQYFRGVKVEHGVVTAHARGGELQTVSGEVGAPAPELTVQPVLSEAAALKRALATVGAKRYMWQDVTEQAGLRQRTGDARATYFPTGELVVVADGRATPVAGPAPLVLAWKFNVYARQPISRELLYVDARTGEVVLRDAIIKHVNATGTFATRYSGTKPGTTDAFGGGFRLRETTRGKGVTTLNCQTGTSFAAAVDFVDNDNNWTAAEYNNSAFDNAAFDAHLGAQATQDYWVSQHGRDSYDDRGTVLLSFVHFDRSFENAFWDGSQMVYGDGGSRFSALTSVDVCAHEMGHAICSTTADLVYRNESGAINEGLSDIWGACVEYHFDPTKQTWLIGEDIDMVRPSLRSMSNPNAERQPDTYLGRNWFTGTADNGGVHTNSGVINYWFYLLSVGGSGTNDNGTAFTVPGISIEKAGRIVYRAERLYMTANATYRATVLTTMQAAVDLYGLSSPEATAVAKAWRAVGLGDGNPTLTAMTPTSGPIGTVVTLTGTNLSTTFRVTFNGTPVTAATFATATQLIVEVPPGATTGSVVVTTAAGPATSTGVFTVTSAGPAPTVLSYSPAAGAPQGATVIITGTNLTGATAVTFNGTNATFTVNSATQITTTVPATATSGPLRVASPAGSATAPTSFLVLPNITGLSPMAGPVGTTVTITGTSFTGTLHVKFNGTYATFTANSPTRITATVPIGATTGPVTLRTPSGAATSPAPFVVNPTLGIIRFTPGSGAPLTTIVTVYGIGFTGTSEVRFNATPATTFSVASDTELWATVPAGATTGPIRVTTPLGTVSSTSAFNVLIPGAPRIDSFTPAIGPVGTTVAITGIDFTGTTAVAFNGTAATVVTNTDTRLVVVVPAGATTGQISVTTALGTGVSTNPFRVLVPPTNDLCTSPSVPVVTCGSVVTGTIYGADAVGDPQNGCGTPIDGGGGVFYRFVGTGRITMVETCGGITDYDSKLHVFSGTCGALTCIGGDDDGCGAAGGGSVVTFTATAGTTYYFFVSGWTNSVGDFTLSVSCSGTLPLAITGFTPASGPVGTVVSLKGSRFSSVTGVRFGNAFATTFLATTDSTITVTVPLTATTGPITVRSATATAVSSTDFVVVRPTVVSFTPSSGPVGTVVTMRGTRFTGTTGVFFAGVPASAAFTVVSDTELTATVPVGALTAAIAVTTPIGTVRTATEFQVTVPAPANDLCSAAGIPLLTCGATVTGSTLGSTTTGDPTLGCGVGITGGGVFYRFVGTGAPVTVETCGGITNFDTKLHVFSGTCGSFTCVAGNDDACVSASRVTFASLTGTSYFIFVSGFGTSTGNFTLAVSCSVAPTIAGFTPTSGPVGTVVTMTGRDFGGVSAVRFGTIAATSFSVNPAGTQLTAVVPAGAGYARLNLTTTGGTTASPDFFCTQYTPTATGDTRCGPGSLTLTATGGPAFAWYTAATGGTPIAGATSGTYQTPALTATTRYYVAVALDASCPGPRVPVTATITAQPTVRIAGPATTCAGTSVMLTASGAASYRWSTGATTDSITVTTAGTYTVTGMTTGGCAAAPVSQAVAVTPLPGAPAITQAVQASGIVLLTSSAATGNQWYRNGVLIAGATAPTYAVTAAAQNGAFTVRTTNAADCVSLASAAQTVIVTGTADDFAAPAWTLWPNPAREAVRVRGAAPRTALAVYDATGRRVRVVTTDADGAATLDLTGLARGVYAVRADGRTRRLVVE